MSEFSTPLSARLGLRFPLIAAPMFLISNKEMLLACAEVGILGAMPSLNARTPEKLEADLKWLKERTDKPFGINVPIRLIDPARLQADVGLCLEYEVPVLITSYGDPTPIVRAAHAKGVTVFHDVINLKHAKKAEAAGVDAIIGVGQGAGGHAGEVNPFVLFPYLKANLSVPVIGAGCISGGAQVAATLALGAELAYIGTRFIASEESGAPEAYKQMVLDSTHQNVVYTDQVTGTKANFLEQTLPSPGDEAKVKRWKDVWSAGQGVSLVHETKPIAAIVDDIVAEYHQAIAQL